MSFAPESSRYCSQGHTNLPGSRYCSICGEKLSEAASASVGGGDRPQDSILEHRYRIVRLLGSGGFGRTYLAEDLNRFHERCVLKEFAPQVQGEEAVQKAQALFEREAGVLYQLRHPQIPRFRELLRTQFEQQSHLFLIQDYVDGKTYQQILETRRLSGKTFAEGEVLHLLRSLLPVLHYIHQQGVIHRDIAPDNLILRSTDQLPVLIDFGGVKQVAATVASQFASAPAAPSPEVTRLGKAGYAPAEQMQTGEVSPQSDLYALGATAVVLLSGRDPAELGDMAQGDWKGAIAVQPTLMQVLERLLAADRGDRFPTAQAALAALPALSEGDPPLNAAPPPPSPPAIETEKTQAVAPAGTPGAASPTTARTVAASAAPASPAARSPDPNPVPTSTSGGNIAALIATVILFIGAVSALWFTRDRWVPLFTGAPTDTASPAPETPFSPEEQARKEALTARRDELGVSSSFLVQLTDATFYRDYPEMQGSTLSDAPEDAVWRERWDAIALDWLDWLANNLSRPARRQLGSYDAAQRNNWKNQVNRLNVSSRALNDLADAQFFHHFSEWRGADFINQPIGQIWQGIAFDQLRALQAGDRLQTIQFDAGEFSATLDGELAPGSGQVYIAELSQGQLLRLSLAVPADTTLLSLYLPVPTEDLPVLLEDSPATQWSGELPQSGFYEIVVVSQSDAPFRYSLDLAADQVTTTPIEPEPSPTDEADLPIAPDTEDD